MCAGSFCLIVKYFVKFLKHIGNCDCNIIFNWRIMIIRGGARGDPDGGATFPDRGAQFYMPR